MSKRWVGLFLAAAPLAPANAQTMPVSEFLARAEALQSKGIAALFSSDIKLLRAQVVNFGKIVRAEEAATRKAGRRPDICMPKKAAVQSDELMAYLKTIPASQRGASIQQAFRGLMKKKYPCPS
jgi:hypothetical protein